MNPSNNSDNTPIEDSLLEGDSPNPNPLNSYSSGEFELGVAATPLAQMSPADKETPPQKVLVLEDDPAQLFILQQHLESLNLEILTASTIEEARERLKDEKVELAVFDVQLPDGCGLDLCGEIDDSPEHMGLPVIVLSSLDQPSIIRETRAAGGCYFISKPYDPNVLLTVIERLLGDVM